MKEFSKRRFLPGIVMLSAMALLPPVASASVAETSVKQSVFLICPQTAEHSAWSVYLSVDGSDHSKVLALGLEELTGENSSGSSYARVLAAQSDPRTERRNLGTLDARDFSSGELVVKKDDALHIQLTPQPDGSYEVMCSVRIGASDRFVIGGKEKARRSAQLKYDARSGIWHAQVEAMSDSTGAKIPHAIGRTITGVLFPITATGIYMVAVAFDDGTGVVLLDR